MHEFRPALPLEFTDEQKSKLTAALMDISSLEPHSLRSVSGITHAEAVRLMYQLTAAGLTEMWLRVFDEEEGGVAFIDIPYSEARLKLPYIVPYREDPIEDPSVLRYGLVVKKAAEFEIR